MELLFHNKLKEGQLINVYTHYMLEESYEGVAVLLEKHSDGRSFSLYNEKLQTKEEDRVIDQNTRKYKPLTKDQVKNNKVWTRINSFFEDAPTKEIKALKDRIKKKVSRADMSLIDLYNTIKSCRFKYMTNISKIGFFFELFTDDQIARYFQQKYIRYWSPTIFREERWLVEFIPEQYGLHNQMCLYNSPFRTYRKIRTIAKVSPSEDIQYCEIRKHTTLENGVSNDDRRIMRLAITDYDDQDDRDDTDQDDDHDDDIDLDEDYDNSEGDLAEDSFYTEGALTYKQHMSRGIDKGSDTHSSIDIDEDLSYDLNGNLNSTEDYDND